MKSDWQREAREGLPYIQPPLIDVFTLAAWAVLRKGEQRPIQVARRVTLLSWGAYTAAQNPLYHPKWYDLAEKLSAFARGLTYGESFGRGTDEDCD